EPDRDQERDAPAPCLECFLADDRARDEDDEERHEERETGCGLNPADVKPATPVRRMLGRVDDRPAVLAAVGKPLDDPQRDQQDRRDDPRGRVGRQQADAEGRQSHHRDRDQERLLATGAIADAAEEQRAERAHGEACGERQEREDEPGRLVHAGEELTRDQRRERAEQDEIVGLEDRAGRGAEHDSAELPVLGAPGGDSVGDRVRRAHSPRSGSTTTPFNRSQRRMTAVLSAAAPTSSRPSAKIRFTSSSTGVVAPSAAARPEAIDTSFASRPSVKPVEKRRGSTCMGKLISTWKLRPVDALITSTMTAGSRPKRFPTINASAVAANALAATMLLRAFIACPQPRRPTRTSRSPSTRRIGSAVASAASSSVPIMIVSVPVSAFATSPETGA